MNKELNNVIKLAKRTGDRIIVFDPEEPNESFVLMDLESYEKLNNASREGLGQDNYQGLDVKNLTENELIDKINRDIAIWKNEDESRKLDSYKLIENFLQAEEGYDEDFEIEEEDNYYYYDEQETSPSPSTESHSGDSSGRERDSKSGSWDIPVDIKKGAEEVKE